jgi:thiamine pyrophosphate-dependent acetolactate synthase large subunit-like protein
MLRADYIFQTLVDYSIRHIFVLTGSGSMFQNYDLGSKTRSQTQFNQHEHACAIAADGHTASPVPWG